MSGGKTQEVHAEAVGLPRSGIFLAERRQALISAWRQAFGVSAVIDAIREADLHAPSTLPRARPPNAILRVHNRRALETAFELAKKHRLRLQVASGLRNLGFGTADPADQDAVLLDLSSMDRIEDFDSDLGHISVEPGVTFAQIHAFLTERRAKWFLPSIGGPADASVMGNFLERGHGTGPHVRRPERILTLEVMLSTGEMLALSEAAGPDWRGAFTQSTLGVATLLRLKLSVRPACLRAVIAEFRSAADVVEGALLLRQLLLNGALGPNVLTFWNRAKLEIFQGRTGEAQPMLDPRGSEAAWRLSGALYAASAQHAELAGETLIEALPQAECLDDADLPCKVKEAFLGGPSLISIDELPTGLAWVCPMVPFARESLSRALELLGSPVEGGIKASAGFHVDDPSVIDLFIGLHFDLNLVPAPAVRAAILNLSQRFEEAGMSCNRRTIFNPVVEPALQDWRMRLRKALDPEGVMLPDRHGTA